MPRLPPRPIDNHPLPKCSYINTDFIGDDIGAGRSALDDEDSPRGTVAGSSRACKAACAIDDDCFFWTYRPDNGRRDCFLKAGTPG